MLQENTVRELSILRTKRYIRASAILLVLIGLTEFAIMLVLHPLDISDIAEAVVDSILLGLILVPAIYFLFIRQVVSDTEHSLQDSLQVAEDLFRSMPAGIYIYRYKKAGGLTLEDGNFAAGSLTDKNVEDLKGKSFDEIWPAAKELGITDQFLNVAHTGVPFSEENITYTDKDIRIDTLVNVFMLSDSRLAVSFVDISEQKLAEVNLRRSKDEIQELANNLELKVEERTLELNKLNKELETLSYLDGLTGVANRRLFDELSQKEWKRCQRNKVPLSLVMFDIDYFKQFNDYYGHQEGDSCLQLVAKSLASVAHRPADLLARYGGEEFVLLLPETSAASAMKIAEKCRESIIEKAIPHERSTVRDIVTISGGVYCYTPESGKEVSSLIESADKALYKAKEAGRNRVG